MKFKDLNNNVHDIEVGFESLLPKGSVRITDVEATTLLASRPRTKQEIIKSLADALQNMLDTEAQKLGYDNINTAVSYAGESAVATFQAEGKSFSAWRSNVWEYYTKTINTKDTQLNQEDIMANTPKRL